MRIGRWISIMSAILLLNIVLVGSSRETPTQKVTVPVDLNHCISCQYFDCQKYWESEFCDS